ncbi:MAG: branched-chain amino acid transport system II carrier protein [Lachnospiraceae bacterium]|nr:branched-chain amino acid transport system II carrier protein [Candidatus Equihabitans merdae]
MVAGFALFAIIFGACNLIFPPDLGVEAGTQWFASFLGFFIMDVVLAVLGVFAMVNKEGSLDRFGEKLGKKINTAFIFVVVMCIGPLVSIPRTGAVTYSMGIKPVFRLFGDYPLAQLLFTIVFFAIVLAFSIKPGKVIDLIGKYMTPILLICLLFTIIAGVVTAVEAPGSAMIDNPIKEGIVNGYQTMDAMGAIIFAGIVIKAAVERHPGDKKAAAKETYGAGLIAAGILFIVYLGLTYLGTVWGKPFGQSLLGGDIDQAGLIDLVVGQILGWAGVYLIAIITFFACLTTAVGLATASAELLNVIFKKKISYKALVIIICVVSCLIANIGLSQIMAIANPILSLLYPVVITMIALGLMSVEGRYTYRIGVGVAFAISLMKLLCDTLGLGAFAFVHKLPLDVFDLSFVVPTVIAVLIGLLLDRKLGK